MDVVYILLYFIYGSFCDVKNDKDVVYISCVVDNVSGFYEVFDVLCSRCIVVVSRLRYLRWVIPLLCPYLIHKFHQENKLITEQSPGEYNPLIQLAIDTTGIPW